MEKEEFLKLFTQCVKEGDIKIKYVPEVMGNLYPDMRSPYVKEEARFDINVKGTDGKIETIRVKI